jgi:PST family polysaccharide transporter
MANIFIGLTMLVSEFGLGAAIIAIPDLSPEEVGELNTLSVISGIALFAVSCVLAYPIGLFFHAQQLPAILIAMSVSFLITSFKTVPDALLQKGFRFKLLAQIQGIQAVTYAFTIAVGAWNGAGYWSLVIGAIAGATIGTLLAIWNLRPPFARPHFHSLKRSTRLSWHILVSRISWYSYSNSDFLVAGRMLGQSALGAYNVAWTIASVPAQRVTDLVTRVLPVYFSRAQTNDAELRKYVLTITEVLLLVTLPASLGLFVIASELIQCVLGPKWVSATPPLRILSVYIALRSITTLFAPLLNVKGGSRLVMWNNVAAAVFFPIGFVLGSRWGLVGIAMVWPILYPFVVVPLLVKTLRQIKLSWSSYLASTWSALTTSSVMAAYLLVFKILVPADGMHVWLHLAVEILSAVGVYYVALHMRHRDRLRQLYCSLITR